MMRRNNAEPIGYLLLVICFALYFLPLTVKVNVFSRQSVGFWMIATAVYLLIWMFLPPLIFFISRRKTLSLKIRLLFAGITLLFTAAMVFGGYPTNMPQLYRADSPNPFREIKKAVQVLNDDSEPITETGICTVRRYRGSRINSTILTRYALCTERGAVIPCNARSNGLYTVTYSPATYLPVEIQPYDPECGENVIAWGAAIPAGLLPRNNQACVRVKQLERAFPNMKLCITKDGAVYKEKSFSADDKDISLSIPPDAKGTFSAQLYAVRRGIGGEQAYPISNLAVLHYR